MGSKQFLGLDLGTNSIGWCLTDENYDVIKKQGKSLWGVRLFDEASDCKERRMHRGATRRLERRKKRIRLLQSLFNDEIKKVDKSFFERLELSKFHFEDRVDRFNNVQTLFIDKNFSDKQYYKKYPTIYRLRKHLLESKDKEDIRLIYLAIHHAIKYRGNFLSLGQTFNIDSQDDLQKNFENLNEQLRMLNKDTIKFDAEIYKDKIKPSIEKRFSISIVKDVLKEYFPTADKYIEKIVYPLIAGAKVKVADIYELAKGDEENLEKKDITFSSETFDLDFEEIKMGMQDDTHSAIVLNCKAIYNFFKLESILKGKKYLSLAMDNRYECHKQQLAELKNYVKKHGSLNLYNKIFREVDKDLNNYPRYVGSNRVNNQGQRFNRCSKDDFYKFLKNALNLQKNITDDEYLNKINELMNDGEFLAKQNSTDNGIFPYQMNEMEINQIIDNQKQYYPFFDQRDETGLSVKEKILAILKFKIPYFVGPLNSKSPFAWCQRKEGKEHEEILPWNIESIVDYEKTAETFINKSLNHCTYLNDEFCLPKNSIQYSAFNLLNELNKIFINGKPITYEDKIDVIENLFISDKRKVTKKSLKNFFKGKYGTEVSLTTSNDKELEEIKCNLNSYRTFVQLLGRDFVDHNIQLIDKIIRDITLFDDKAILASRLRKIYHIDESIIGKIKTLTYEGYGRLSEKLITGLKVPVVNINTGEVIFKSILRLMLDTNENFMEIINNSDYNFKKLIDENNPSEEENVDIESYVDALYVNPQMKRTLIQAYRIIEELKKITKKPIDEYYVEVSRSNQAEKVRKLSRRTFLIQLYKQLEEICRKETENQIAQSYDTFIKEGLEALNNKSDSEFRSDKLFLYYLQLGRCMYSNKPIALSDLYDSKICDIDHIIPQSKLKDDSIENRVLVLQEFNRCKSDVFPIPQSLLFTGHQSFYRMLHKNRLMGNKKLNNLLRNEPLSDNELQQFVNRQLVTTNQAVDALINLIKHMENMDETKVIYSKAENVTIFRKKFNIVKCRDTNDLHHAHDAYLNIVVGRTLSSYFGYKGDKEYYKRTFNIEKILERNVYSGKTLVYEYPNTLQKVKKQIFTRFDILVTKRQYVGNKLFEQISIQPAAEGLYPLKASDNRLLDTAKYGGYNHLANGFYCLVKSLDKKGKEFVSIEAMQNIYVKPTDSIEKKKEYLIKIKKLNNPQIINELLRINMVIEQDHKKFCITGKTNESLLIQNLKQITFAEKEINLFKKLSKLNKICMEKGLKLNNKDDSKIKSYFKITEDLSNHDSEIVISPAKNDKVQKITLKDSELIEMYKIIVTKLNKNVLSEYSNLNKIKINLEDENSFEKFNNLNIFLKAYVITEMLNLTKCDRVTSDLSLIGLSANSGVLVINKKITAGMRIVNESITGYYRKVIYEAK